MDTRSTNYGFASPRNIISNVGSSHGVMLSGGSTGGRIESIGDDANITLLIVGKGTGSVQVGNSVSPVTINGETTMNSTYVLISSTRVQIGGGSTTALSAIQRYTVQFTEPDCPASTYVDSTYTVTGATTNASYKFTPRLTLAAGYIIGDVRCSTADEVTIRWATVGASTASGSSNRGTLLQFSF